MTTRQLADKFNVKVETIHKAHFNNGHYRGYKPTGYDKPETPKCGVKQYVWEKQQ